GDRRRRSLPDAAPAGDPRAALQPVARRGQAQEALLPPVAGRRGGAATPARRVAGAQPIRDRHPGGGPLMALIDRYLFAIKAQLPEAQREDVTAELRDTLLSQAEEREAELGRPLDEDDWT